jgi:hypothetical protein
MSEEIMRANLLVLGQTYADAKGWQLTTVSKQIHGNQYFFRDFIAGEISTTLKTYFQMIDKLRLNWPVGLQWPITRDIPHPSKVPHRTLPERGDGGKFLGKKLDKPRRRA